MHTGQHYDRELSEVFLEELGLPEPRYRLDLRTADPDVMQPEIERVDPRRGPRPGPRLRGHELDPRGRARGRRLGRPARARRGGAPQRRPVDARGARADRGGPASRGSCSARTTRARRDARRRRASSARRTSSATSWPRRASASRRSRASASRCPFEPRTYVVATVHRQANVFQPRLGRIVEGLNRIDDRVVFPAHPRTRAHDRAGGDRARRARPRDGPAQLPRAGVARVAGARDRDRLRRPPEGGVLVRRAVRDPAPVDGVDRHRRGRRERARGRRSRARSRRRSPTPTIPERRPQLYGDGHASARIASVLVEYDARPMKRDVAIVGAGYVGVPLAQAFAEAGKTVVLVDVDASARRAAEPRRELHRGRLLRDAGAARRAAGA